MFNKIKSIGKPIIIKIMMKRTPKLIKTVFEIKLEEMRNERTRIIKNARPDYEIKDITKIFSEGIFMDIYPKDIDQTKQIEEMRQVWGNAIGWFDYKTRRISGHFRYLHRGDYIIGHMESGKKAIFMITEIKYEYDPSDMFFATVEDMGYWKGE